MPNQNHHGGYPIGSVDYVPKSFKRRGAFIRYISAGSVIWLFKPDIEAHYVQLEARARTTQPPLTNSPQKRGPNVRPQIL